MASLVGLATQESIENKAERKPKKMSIDRQKVEPVARGKSLRCVGDAVAGGEKRASLRIGPLV